MKKSTQQKLVAVVIVLIFGLSGFAFIATSFTGAGGAQETGTLQGYVIEGEIDPQLESAYINNGVTFLKFYYEDPELISYIETLPERFVTNDGQVQLVAQKIPSVGNRARILSINNDIEIDDPGMDDINNALCKTLLVVPVECALIGMGEPE